MTTAAAELVKHEQWMRRARAPDRRPFYQLLTNEFCSAAEIAAAQERALTQIVRHAVTSTRYYARLFADAGLTPTDIDNPTALRKLPLLHKHEVVAAPTAFHAKQLPAGEQLVMLTRSSGTTGQPVAVYHSTSSAQMFGLLAQRHMRWFGFDPSKTMVAVCIPTEMPKTNAANAEASSALVRTSSWSFVGNHFATGPQYAFSIANPTTQQLAWLREIEPQYVKGFPSVFEEWLLANDGAPPVTGLHALFGISAQMTPALRARLEQAYQIPIEQGYGLNEIGIVAGRCVAGRYHVHAEHCLVEIVDEAGHACPPGAIGKIIVTALRNFAMPLLRYDTGDLALAVTGPCRCGRSLPAFGEIEGRYRRYAGLPTGTKARVNTLIDAIGSAPPADLQFLRRYQIYQDRHNCFELRLVTVAPIPETFRALIADAWAGVAGPPPVSLLLREVDAVAPAPSGKLLDFDSEFHADASVNPHARGPNGELDRA